MNKKYRILLVDDHPLIREGIAKIINHENDMETCGEAASANDAIELMPNKNPDCVIVDISLEGSISGLDLVKALRKRYEDVKILVLSMHDEKLYAERAIRAGARGYVTKKEAPSTVIKAIRAVMNGELYLNRLMTASIIDRLIQEKSGSGTSAPQDLLSDREFEIFRLIGSGYATGEIAKQLNLSVNTIESHRNNIKEKLLVKKGTELTKLAVQWTVNQVL